MDFKVLLATFGTIFLAELGDKTQIACILMASKTGKPVAVFLGTASALVLVSLLGVLFAQLVCQYLPGEIIKKVAAVGFVVIGGLMFWGKL
ncbi:MAG: TMEM165/GDT1 family protein [Deltaproteobacteria bacterium]|nr:TMEM165/GDT1 family protein [Deltaproteobacteria bacterium]